MTLSAAGSWSGATWVFWICGVITLAGAIGTITRRNPVSAALWLILTLFATGGVFLALHATFLAVIQVLVYAGAVMVLFVFVVMAVSDVNAERFAVPRAWLSKIVGLVALGVVVDRLLRVFVAGGSSLAGASAAKALPPDFGTVRSVGRLLFSTYLLPFEVLSVLLLVAVIAAVTVTRHRREAPANDGATEASGPALAHRVQATYGEEGA